MLHYLQDINQTTNHNTTLDLAITELLLSSKRTYQSPVLWIIDVEDSVIAGGLTTNQLEATGGLLLGS